MKESLNGVGTAIGKKLVDVGDNGFRLVNPLFWKAVWDVFVEEKFMNPRILVQGFLAVVLPTIILTVASPDQSAAMKLAVFSPWAIGSALPALTQATIVSFVIMSWGFKRAPALPEAVAMLESRIAEGRAYRTHRYDVFLPNAASPKFSESKKGVILIPGALMEHRSYAEIAARLSDEGLLVIVLSLEPLRVAVRHGGADPSDVQRSINKTLEKNGLDVDEWVLAAHSQGSVRAIDLPGELSKDGSKVRISKIVLWARGNAPFETEASKILLVQGEKDSYMAMRERNPMEECIRSLPRSKEVTIKGADHNQFGSYQSTRRTKNVVSAPKTGAAVTIDPATISRKQQQDITAQLTAKFCRDELPLN